MASITQKIKRRFAGKRSETTGKRWKRRSRRNGYKWTNGGERLEVYFMSGAGSHAGWVCEANNGGDWLKGNRTTLQISNGFVSKREALMLADIYMAEGGPVPAFPAPDMRQDEWLREHLPDYEWEIINPAEL